MGSTGIDFRCPLCGWINKGEQGYALDIVGYPLGGCCWNRVLEGLSPSQIRSRQLKTIWAMRQDILPNSHSNSALLDGRHRVIDEVMQINGLALKILSFTLPSDDFTLDFLNFARNMNLSHHPWTVLANPTTPAVITYHTAPELAAIKSAAKDLPTGIDFLMRLRRELLEWRPVICQICERSKYNETQTYPWTCQECL